MLEDICYMLYETLENCSKEIQSVNSWFKTARDHRGGVSEDDFKILVYHAAKDKVCLERAFYALIGECFSKIFSCIDEDPGCVTRVIFNSLKDKKLDSIAPLVSILKNITVLEKTFGKEAIHLVLDILEQMYRISDYGDGAEIEEFYKNL